MDQYNNRQIWDHCRNYWVRISKTLFKFEAGGFRRLDYLKRGSGTNLAFNTNRKMGTTPIITIGLVTRGAEIWQIQYWSLFTQGQELRRPKTLRAVGKIRYGPLMGPFAKATVANRSHREYLIFTSDSESALSYDFFKFFFVIFISSFICQVVRGTSFWGQALKP